MALQNVQRIQIELDGRGKRKPDSGSYTVGE